MVVFGQKWLKSGEIGSIRAKVVVLGAKVVVFEQKLWCSGKIVVFKQK